MKTQIEAYPIVYGRTDFVDYRVLAFPMCIKDSLNKIWKVIENNLLISPHLLQTNNNEYRWLIAKESGYTIFGVASFAENFSQDKNKSNNNNRPFVVFLGYAVENNKIEKLTTFSHLMPPKELYTKLYKYVIEKWEDKTKFPPLTEDIEYIEFSHEEPKKIKLETFNNDKTIFSAKNNLQVWDFAFMIKTSNDYFVGIGMPNVDTIAKSIFNIATINNYPFDYEPYKLIIRENTPKNEEIIINESDTNKKKAGSENGGMRVSTVSKFGLAIALGGAIVKYPLAIFAGISIAAIGEIFKSKN